MARAMCLQLLVVLPACLKAMVLLSPPGKLTLAFPCLGIRCFYRLLAVALFYCRYVSTFPVCYCRCMVLLLLLLCCCSVSVVVLLSLLLLFCIGPFKVPLSGNFGVSELVTADQRQACEPGNVFRFRPFCDSCRNPSISQK